MFYFQIEEFQHSSMALVTLIHSANPKSRPVGVIVFAHVVRPSPLFRSSKTKQQKQCSLLA